MLAFRDHLLAPPHARGGLSRPRAPRRRHDAAAVRQPARARDPAQRARRLRRPLRAARGRAVLPAAAHDAARGLADRRRRGDHRRQRARRRCRRWSRCSACRPRPRSTCSTTTTPSTIASAATSSTWRSISPPAGAGSRRSAQVIARWVAHLLGVEVDGRAAHRAAATSISPGMSASTPTARGSATRSGTARSSTTPTRARVVGLFRLTFRDPDVGAGQGQGRAGLSDPGDDAGQDAAPEAAEPRHRPADQASGGGDMSAPRCAHSGRRRGRAPQGDEPVDRFHLAAGRRCCPAQPDSRAVDAAVRRRRARDVLCRRRRRSSCIAPRPRNYRDNLASGAPALWVVLRPTGVEPPYRARRASPPIRPKAKASPRPATIWSSRCRCRSRSATRSTAFVAEHHVEQPFFKRKRDRADPEALARRGPRAEGRRR